MQLDDITAWKVERWIVDRKKLGISPATINRQVGMLKASLARAVKWQILTVNPLSAIKAQRLDKNVKVRFLSDEEEHHLMIALHNREQRRREERNSGNSWRKKRGIEPLEVTCSSDFSDHLFPMVLISLNTGMRRGELFSLTWNNVDLVRQIITVEGACAKSGQTRHIPMNATVLEVFRKLSKSAKSDLIFVGRDGGMFDNVKRSWMRVLKEANINTFRWHDMRHHFASRLVQRGVDLNTVRVLLGHKDLKMTLRYAHLSPQVMAEAVSRLV
jgi:integrase